MMAMFRLLLATLLAIILIYTAIVMSRYGATLFPVFFGNIAALDWQGQFNVDFSCFLVLSAVWLAWRHHFSSAGLGFAVLGIFGGSLFLTAYLLIVSIQVKGDMNTLLLGPARSRRG